MHRRRQPDLFPSQHWKPRTFLLRPPFSCTCARHNTTPVLRGLTLRTPLLLYYENTSNKHDEKALLEASAQPSVRLGYYGLMSLKYAALWRYTSYIVSFFSLFCMAPFVRGGGRSQKLRGTEVQALYDAVSALSLMIYAHGWKPCARWGLGENYTSWESKITGND